jgi:glycosyltransferase involved in cell wall biosynthesis
MTPKITVCIVTYNHGEMLRESIHSVLDQTYKDIAVVVLDDASPDNAWEITASFRDPRIRCVRHERNIGALSNWNYAIDCAETEYVNVFHGDDRMFPWMVEKLIEALEGHPEIGLAASAGDFFLGSGPIPARRKITEGKHYRAMEFVREYAARAVYPIVAPSITIRKSAFDTNGIRYRTDVGPAADTYFVLEANGSGVEMFTANEPLLEYRRHEASWTNRSGFDAWFASLCKVEELARGLAPDIDMSRWENRYAKWLFGVTSTIQGLEGDAARHRKTAEAMGWRVSDADFLEAILEALRRHESGFALRDIKDGLRRLFGENQWKFSDRDFDHFALRYTAKEYIKQIGEGKKTYADYRKFRSALQASGVKIQLCREAMWFIKYALLKGPRGAGK